jgi:hypothetical protein
MVKAWNKGLTKGTHPSLMKTSVTMKSKKIDNFKKWREKQIEKGRFDLAYIPKNELVAELIGVTLGDGNIALYPRCERLTISSHSEAKKFIKRYSDLVEKIFKKKPSILRTNQKCIRISIYQRAISKRLSIPSGNRSHLTNLIPKWIKQNERYIIACLKGLFEAEGSLSVHLSTYTYNFEFRNLNPCLLDFVKNSLEGLRYHPEIRKTATRLRKKDEVMSFKKLIKFRE